MKGLCILLASLLICSCDLGKTPEEGCVTAGYKLNCWLTDTNGVGKATFKSGEDFVVTLAITNMTGEIQVITHTGPVVIFSVLSADSTVATSVDGFSFPQNVIFDTLGVAETLTFPWKGPNSGARIPRRSLAPGYYKIAAEIGGVFGSHTVCAPRPLNLSVE